MCVQGTLNFQSKFVDRYIDWCYRSMLGTVAAILAVFVAIITTTLLGLVITIFVIVKKKLKTICSGETQFINQATAHGYIYIIANISLNNNYCQHCRYICKTFQIVGLHKLQTMKWTHRALVKQNLMNKWIFLLRTILTIANYTLHLLFTCTGNWNL